MEIQLTYITPTWPGGPVRLPPVYTGPVEVTDEMIFVSVSPETLRQVTLAPGVCLRELPQLDLASPSEVGRFVAANGNPGHYFLQTGPTWNQLQLAYDRFVAGVSGGDERRPRDLPKPPTDVFIEQMRQRPGTRPYLMSEFIERVRVLRDITRLSLYRAGEMSLTEVVGAWESVCIHVPEDDVWALFTLVLVLNWSVSGFQPLIEIAQPERFRADETPRFEDALYLYQPGLFDVLSLQLFNDIAAGATYKRCANETCRRWFNIVPKRMDGTTSPVAMRHSTDAIFCREACARMQVQREHRRRQRALELHKRGLAVEEIAQRVGWDAKKTQMELSIPVKHPGRRTRSESENKRRKE